MTDEEQEFEYFLKAVLYLAHPENRTKSLLLNDVYDACKIPVDYRSGIHDLLWFEHEVIEVVQRDIHNPIIKISEKGLQLANKIDEQIFQVTGSSSFNDSINMTYQELFELIFQEHKKAGKVIWHKHTFDPMPDNIFSAREMMANAGIIFFAETSGKAKTTLLSHDFLTCNSYAEAVELIERRKRPAPVSQTFNGPVGTTITSSTLSHSPTSSMIGSQSIVNEGKSNAPDKKRKTPPLQIVAWIVGIIAGLFAIWAAIKGWIQF